MTKPRVAVAGATGTIGRAVVRELLDQGFATRALGRRKSIADDSPAIETHVVNFSDRDEVAAALSKCDAVISCITSRSGTPKDAWSVDHDANLALMEAAKASDTKRFVLLSAICVQKPKLTFQKAKRAFEKQLQLSALDWTIIHPTAFFKSLSGQVARVQSGKPFLVFDNGTLTACKPISDRDLARFIIQKLTEPSSIRRTLPIGGPGPAITPKDQAAMLERLLGRKVQVRGMPVALMRAIVSVLTLCGRIIPRFKDRAEFARTGLYYGTESMLVWDADAQRYDAGATPEFGSDTLEDHYARLLSGELNAQLGDHAAFKN